MTKPTALFTSCSSLEPSHIIKDILGSGELPAVEHVFEEIRCYPWCIETRYYVANIWLSTVPNRTITNEQFAENVQAFVVHFDTTKRESLESVKRWLPYLSELEPEVRLLLCDTCQESDEVTRLEAWQWCLDNCFELIELHPTVDMDLAEFDDDFPETTGMARVKEALQSHTWSNLVMKEKPSFRSSYMDDLMREHSEEQAAHKHPCAHSNGSTVTSSNSTAKSQKSESHEGALNETDNSEVKEDIEQRCTSSEHGALPNSSQCDEGLDHSDKEASGSQADGLKQEKESKNKDEVLESLMDEDKLNAVTELENDEDGFEKLFENFRIMKERAESMPLDERKKYAEKVAIQFWRAVGGDEDEIANLDSDLDSDTG